MVENLSDRVENSLKMTPTLLLRNTSRISRKTVLPEY